MTSITEKAGKEARYLHKGMTSSDVLDTCFNLQLKQSGEILLKDINVLLQSIKKQAIKHKFDLAIDEPGRQFFYLPLMHSESLQDQERCIRLMHERMPLEGMNNLLHARAHREVIRKFGRFPTRNEALSRKNTAHEADYMKNGGYGMTYTQLAKSAYA